MASHLQAQPVRLVDDRVDFCWLCYFRYFGGTSSSQASARWAKFIQEQLFTFDYEETAAWYAETARKLSPLGRPIQTRAWRCSFCASCAQMMECRAASAICFCRSDARYEVDLITLQ
jgi:hypothetical protein